METDTMMIDEPTDYEGNPLMCCIGCGEPYSATGWIDVIDTVTMTAQVVCHMSCFDTEDDMILIPPHAFDIDGEPDIPEWAYNDTQTTEPQPVAMVDEAKVIQILAPWDSPTDILMYEFNDGDEGVDA